MKDRFDVSLYHVEYAPDESVVRNFDAAVSKALRKNPALKTQKDVKDFMEKCEIALPPDGVVGPHWMPHERLALLRRLVVEETLEFEKAMEDLEELLPVDDPLQAIYSVAQVVDALCDIIVTVHNVSNAFGIDLEPYFDEVHRSNMDKAGGPKREDGKQLKPEGWRPPNLVSIYVRDLGRSLRGEGE